jgi:hypothetical protein
MGRRSCYRLAAAMLINCPDCDSEVSDLASACPRCARPIADPILLESPDAHDHRKNRQEIEKLDNHRE